MKRFFWLCTILLVTNAYCVDIPGLQSLEIGDAAPAFSLPGIDDQTHTLEDYKEAKILVIAFISNHCPDSQAAEQRIIQFVDDFKDQSVQVVAINPNSPEGLRPDELGYSKYNDGFEDMKLHATEQGFNFPYLYDGENQQIAKAYGCLATPHIFIFDQERKLRYKGQFDDSRFALPETVKSADARNATTALLAGHPVPKEITRPHGCSTKWLEKKASVAAAAKQLKNTDVIVELIDADNLSNLREKATGNYRLYNIWATWCAPCIQEFSELVQTAHKFGMRNFELITISLDQPDELTKVQSFISKQGLGTPKRIQKSLKREGRKTNNYIYTGTPEALANALDPDWPGPIPYSVLINPQGKIIWQHSGAVDGQELRNFILNELGRFYVPQ